MNRDQIASGSAPILEFEGNPANRVPGFTHLWLKYCRAFNPKHHCMACLVGPKSARVRSDMRHGAVAIDEHREDLLYLCGVSTAYADAGRRGLDFTELLPQNLHVPVRRAPGGMVSGVTYAGTNYTFRNVELVPMPKRVPDEFATLSIQFTRCRNFIWAAKWLPRKGGQTGWWT